VVGNIFLIFFYSSIPNLQIYSNNIFHYYCLPFKYFISICRICFFDILANGVSAGIFCAGAVVVQTCVVVVKNGVVVEDGGGGGVGEVGGGGGGGGGPTGGMGKRSKFKFIELLSKNRFANNKAISISISSSISVFTFTLVMSPILLRFFCTAPPLDDPSS
jgi:hypothetical protein